MKALRKTRPGVGNLELVEVDVPVPGHGEVLVEVWAAGICGSDLLIEDDKHFYSAPVTIGHEFAGTISALGPGVAGFAVGDLVAADIETPDGWLGVTRDGGCAQYMVVPQQCLWRYPPGTDPNHATFTEPVVAIVHALQERARVRVGDVVLVVGPGPMGLLGVQFAKLAGAATVILVGLEADAARLAIGERLGADVIVHSGPDVRAVVDANTGGRGADVVLEASASAEGFQHAIDGARRSPEGSGGNGTIVTISLWGEPVQVTLDPISLQQLTIHGAWSWNGRQTWERAVDLISRGVLDIDSLVTRHYRLDQWRDAFDALRRKEQLKVYLHPGDFGGAGA